jgi:hypothetical protein
MTLYQKLSVGLCATSLIITVGCGRDPNVLLGDTTTGTTAAAGAASAPNNVGSAAGTGSAPDDYASAGNGAAGDGEALNVDASVPPVAAPPTDMPSAGDASTQPLDAASPGDAGAVDEAGDAAMHVDASQLDASTEPPIDPCLLPNATCPPGDDDGE